MLNRIRLILMLPVLLMAAVTTASPVSAQTLTPDEAVDFAQLLPAALTLLLPAGMILLISSAMPEDKAPATASKLLLVWGVTALAYFGVGFAFQFGGIAQVSPDPDLSGLYWEWYPLDQSVDVDVARVWGVVALRGWFLVGEAATPGALLLFLSHVSLAGSAALVPAGILIQRTRGIIAILTGLLIGALIYPLTGNWLWGGGWLAHLGANLGLGHGLVDFGGASVIFLTGSAVTLMALILLRPASPGATGPAAGDEVVIDTGAGESLTVYDDAIDLDNDKASPLPATPMPSAYLPLLSLLGGALMLVGWFGLATGVHAPTALNFAPAQAAANGLLAALAAALTAGGYSWFTTRELNPLMTARGLVAGLVVAMSGAPFGPVWLFVVTGLLMGLLVPLLIYFFNQVLRLADDLGLLTTYGISALVSLLMVAVIADGQTGQGWNGLGSSQYLGVPGQGVAGLMVAPGFIADWPGQLQAQLLGTGAIMIWALLLGFLLFQTVIAVTDAWARTGLELGASSTSTRPDPDKSAEFTPRL